MHRAKGFPLLLLALLGWPSRPAWADVTVTTRTGIVQVEAGHVLGFQAVHSDGHPHEWTWTLDELDDVGTFTSVQGRARIAWLAPDVVAPRMLTIRATVRGRAGHRGDTGALTLRVTPRTVQARTQAGMAAAKALASLAQAPQPIMGYHQDLAPCLMPYPTPARREMGGVCTWAQGALVAFDDQSTHPGRFSVMRGPDSIEWGQLHGRLTVDAVEAPQFKRPEAIAPWPAGGGPGADPRFIVVLAEGADRFLCRMDLTGHLEPMGRAHGHWSPEPGMKVEGPLNDVTFGFIAGLAVNRDGEVLVADSWGTIRRISPANQVVLLAGTPGVPGGTTPCGHDPSPVFTSIRALALDPETGNLYVGEPTRVRRVTPKGGVVTLLGDTAPGGAVAAADLVPSRLVPAQPCAAPWPKDRPCLASLRNLAVQGGRLLLFDGPQSPEFRTNYNALLAYDPRSGYLVKLVDGPRSDVMLRDYHWGPRFGPLHLFSPYLDAPRCAYLGHYWQRMVAGDQEIFLRGPHFSLDQTMRGERPRAERINLPRAALDRLFPPVPGAAAGRLRLRGETGVLHGGASWVIQAEWDGSATGRALNWTLPEGFTREDLGAGAIRVTAPAVTGPRRIVIRVAEASASSASEPQTAELAIEVEP